MKNYILTTVIFTAFSFLRFFVSFKLGYISSEQLNDIPYLVIQTFFNLLYFSFLWIVALVILEIIKNFKSD